MVRKTYKLSFKNISTKIGFLLLIPLLTQGQHDPVGPFKGHIGKYLDETTQSWTQRAKAPEGAPNVVYILLDDVGFGATSAFGGLIETPNFEKLAGNGLKYTNFHTTGICSPTRAALLTGRNSHSVGMGHHAELGIGTPGYSGDIPFEAGTVAEIFKENGYNTFALGKWHGIHPRDQSPSGPFNRWPTGRGFEHFYGFIGGATDQWHPELVEENTPIDIEPNTRHLNELLVDKAISYVANQKSSAPEKPFFLYLATGAAHSPHQVAKEWSDRYKGKFDGGWDKYREEAFKRQQSLGLLQKGTVLPPRQQGIKAWESLSADEKKVFAKFMEVYAGFLSYTDHEVGRFVDYLKQNQLLENTVIFLIIGDNGGSKEGTYTGTTGLAEKSQGDDVKFLLSQYDKIGTEYTSCNYPLGWSQATNTPFRYWKSDANSEGATHNPLIVHYPMGIKEKGGIRTQYHHVTDILPTTVELTGIKVPEEINGYSQRDFHGKSLAYSFNDPKKETNHTLQYYELHGGRSIYKDGWKAAVYHPRNTFSESGVKDPNFSPAPFSQDKWELYNLREDWNETRDLASKNPAKLEELKQLFDSLAIKNNIYPLRDYKAGVPAPEIKDKIVLLGGATAKLKVNTGKSAVSIFANIVVDQETEGVIFSSGGLTGGTSLFIKDKKVNFIITDGVKEVNLVSSATLKQGANIIKVEYTDDNQLHLYINDSNPVTASITDRKKYLNTFSSDGISLGRDLNAPVSKGYNGTFPFTGTIQNIIIEQPSAQASNKN